MLLMLSVLRDCLEGERYLRSLAWTATFDYRVCWHDPSLLTAIGPALEILQSATFCAFAQITTLKILVGDGVNMSVNIFVDMNVNILGRAGKLVAKAITSWLGGLYEETRL